MAQLGTILICFALGTLPYAIANRIWVRPDFTATEPWPVKFAILLGRYARDLNDAAYLPWIVVAMVVWLLWFRKYEPEQAPERMALQSWAALGLTYVIVLAALTPQSARFTQFAPVRYGAPMIPFFAALGGLCAWQLWRMRRPAGLAFALVLLATNILTITPWNAEFRWTLPAFANEIAHPYPTSYSAVIAYLNGEAEKDDTVLATPDHMNYPLMYALSDRMLFVGSLDAASPLAGRSDLPARLGRDASFPQWVVSFGLHDADLQLLGYFSRPHSEGSREIEYSYDVAKQFPIYFDQTQRPELFWHRFGPRPIVADADRVYVFRRGPARVTPK